MTLENFGILPKMVPLTINETFSGSHQTLPDEIIGTIALYAGFREIFIIDCLLPTIFSMGYIKDISSPSLESSVDRGNIYEVLYRLWKDPQPNFRRMIILARALRMRRWVMARSLVIIFQTKANIWDIFEGVKNGMDAKTLEILLDLYPEFKLERIRTALLAQSEICNNPDIFLYILRECDEKRRRKNQIRRLIELIDDSQYKKIIDYSDWKKRLSSMMD